MRPSQASNLDQRIYKMLEKGEEFCNHPLPLMIHKTEAGVPSLLFAVFTREFGQTFRTRSRTIL